MEIRFFLAEWKVGEILIVTHPIFAATYLIRSKVLLIVRCIPISVTLKYFKTVLVEWVKCCKCRPATPGPLESTFHVE